MPEVQEHAPGMFCWIELATSDSAGGKKFYSELFGWEAVDSPAGPDMVYTMLRLKGKEVGALYQLREDQKSQGVPPHWMSYVAVKSADETAEKVQSLDGKVIMAPFDVMDVGRMAIIQDPLGAIFCVWQAAKHPGFTLVGEPNTFCWDELATTDRQRAIDFYAGLFGWGAKTSESGAGGLVYTEWLNGQQPIGGMYVPTPEMGDIPPNWMPYFAVTDADATANKAKSLGAKLMMPPTDIPNVGRFSMIQDPQGAMFAIIKLTHHA